MRRRTGQDTERKDREGRGEAGEGPGVAVERSAKEVVYEMLFSACDVEGYVASFPGVGTRRAWDIVPRVREEVLAGCGIEAGLVWLIDEFRPEGQHRELWARVQELLPEDFLEHLRGDQDRARKLLAKRAPRELALAGFLPSDLGYAFGR